MADVRDDLAVVAVALDDLQRTLEALTQRLEGQTAVPTEEILDALRRLESQAAKPQVARTPSFLPLGRILLMGGVFWLTLAAWEAWRGYQYPVGRGLDLLREIDRTLVSQYGHLPEAVRTRLNAVYKGAGALTPQERQGR